MGWFRDLIELGMMEDIPEKLADLMVGRVRDTIGTTKQYGHTLRQPDAIAEKINQWIADGGGFRQKAVWRDDKPEWQQEVPSLYAAIGVGLWNVIGAMTTNVKCKHCGQAFTPKTNTQLYCNEPECRRAKNRLNQRRSRANRAARAQVR
jgi:hypothetical protein